MPKLPPPINTSVPHTQPQPGETTPRGRRRYTSIPNAYLDTRNCNARTNDLALDQIEHMASLPRFGSILKDRMQRAQGEITFQAVTEHAAPHTRPVSRPHQRVNNIQISADGQQPFYDSQLHKDNYGNTLPGPGSDAYVRFNPYISAELLNKPDGQQSIEFKQNPAPTTPPFINRILAHETLHAMRAVTGEQKTDYFEEEDATVGINEYSHAPISENTYADEIGAPRRVSSTVEITNRSGLHPEPRLDPHWDSYYACKRTES